MTLPRKILLLQYVAICRDLNSSKMFWIMIRKTLKHTVQNCAFSVQLLITQTLSLTSSARWWSSLGREGQRQHQSCFLVYTTSYHRLSCRTVRVPWYEHGNIQLPTRGLCSPATWHLVLRLHGHHTIDIEGGGRGIMFAPGLTITLHQRRYETSTSISN